MPSVKNWLRSKRDTDVQTDILNNAYTSQEYVIPVALADDALLSRSSSFSSALSSSSLSGFQAEMIDDENSAWGPTKSKKKASRD
ncbi:hypothetical protein EUX98_g3997 [Antrodiella citrinella]|uniref:Uncharacterized protein n=1 Tax=Antrodiella citrinella TaxID=2447956 RepID=A0A4S4MXJ5_9APHY|nr:hypothetical protein EUX98_g3997 [Antrodiella citrinella]